MYYTLLNNISEPELTPEQKKKFEENIKKQKKQKKLVSDYVNSKKFKRLVELRLKYAELRELKRLEENLEYFLQQNASSLNDDDEEIKWTRSGL